MAPADVAGSGAAPSTGAGRRVDIVFLLGYLSDFGGPKMRFLKSFESLIDYRWWLENGIPEGF